MNEDLRNEYSRHLSSKGNIFSVQGIDDDEWEVHQETLAFNVWVLSRPFRIIRDKIFGVIERLLKRVL